MKLKTFKCEKCGVFYEDNPGGYTPCPACYDDYHEWNYLRKLSEEGRQLYEQQLWESRHEN